jgi:cathepsin B
MSSKNKTFSEEEQRIRDVSRQKKEEETKRKIEEYAEAIERGKQNKKLAEEALEKNRKKKDTNYSYHIMFGLLAALIIYVVSMAIIHQNPNINKVLVIDEGKISEHNSYSQWKQRASSFFEAATLADAKKLFQVGFSNHNNLNQCHQDDSLVPPESFFYKEQWPNCVLPVQDTTKTCGSSYAFALSQTLAERACISDGLQSATELSAQDLLTCDVINNGCKGGYLNNGLDYIRSKGLLTEACYPYKPEQTKCEGYCNDQTRLRMENYCLLVGETEIKRDIMKNGPVVSTMTVHVDFLNYSSGVYTKGEEVAKFSGSHAIKIVGWGVEGDGTKYWIIQNNWGTTWGDEGYAKIALGQDLFFDQYGYSLRVKAEVPNFQVNSSEVEGESVEGEVEKEVSLDLDDEAGN